MRSVGRLNSLHVSCGCNHRCLIAAVATAIVLRPRRILLRPYYAFERFSQSFDLLLMLSLCVPACVVPAWVVPNLLLRGAWNLVFAHACPRFWLSGLNVATRVSSCLHLPNFVATMEVCARCAGGSRSLSSRRLPAARDWLGVYMKRAALRSRCYPQFCTSVCGAMRSLL